MAKVFLLGAASMIFLSVRRLTGSAASALAAEGVLFGFDTLWAKARVTEDAAIHSEAYEGPPGLVLDETPGYDFGKRSIVFSTDPHAVAQMLEQKVLPEDALARLVRGRFFSAVVVPTAPASWGFFDDALVEEVGRNYILTSEVPERLRVFVRADGLTGQRRGKPGVPDGS